MENEDKIDELEETLLSETSGGDLEEHINQTDTGACIQNLITRVDDIERLTFKTLLILKCNERSSTVSIIMFSKEMIDNL